MKVGIDIGGSHIGIGLVDNENKLIDKYEYNWKKEEKKDKEEICKYAPKYSIEIIEYLLKKNHLDRSIIEKIGIGFPTAEIINNKIYMNGKEFDLCKELEEHFKVEVTVKNDVKCSGTYVKELGELREYNNALFLTLGTGIGGAYFYKNKLVVPNKYAGFEIGHMIIKHNGERCYCGQKGCFQAYASMKKFRSQVEQLFNKEHVNSGFVLDVVSKKEKETEMNAIIDNYLQYLAIGLVNLIHIFEPDAICIGGSFAHYESIFIEKLNKKVKEYFVHREIPRIFITKIANDAGIIGATM